MPSPLDEPDRERQLDAAEQAAAKAAAATPPHRREPFPGVDRAGMPADLLAAETNAFRRLSPRRNRWPELVKFDERVAELELRGREAGGRLSELRERIARAPQQDADRFAAWEVNGRKAPRPEPQAEALERAAGEAEAEVAGLETAVGLVLAEKATYVEKHRSRLVKSADAETAKAHERMLAAISELEQARDELIELRAAAVWARLYPGDLAGRTPNAGQFGGGTVAVLRTLGVQHVVQATSILAGLRAEADYWARAATPEQRPMLEGRDQAGRAWHPDTPEGREIERAERQAALERYRQEWGRDPA
jgi:hypothetical protein